LTGVIIVFKDGISALQGDIEKWNIATKTGRYAETNTGTAREKDI
jgi:hypothetical protein